MTSESGCTLTDALQTGGIHPLHVKGRTKDAVLRAMVNVIRLPEDVDRDGLYRMLLAREALESTAVGEGIAIPHPRHPGALPGDHPIVALCFLDKPVDFGALDGLPVFALFALISPTSKIHLHILSRIFFSLRQPEFKQCIVRRVSSGEILDVIRRIEAKIAEH